MSLEPAAALADRVVAAAGGGGCVAIVAEAHEADVRFANNTATTNGVRHERTVTVIRIDTRQGTTVAGSAQASGDVDIAALVAAAESDAMAAEDATALINGDAAPGFDDAPAVTDLSVLGGVIGSLSAAFSRAESSTGSPPPTSPPPPACAVAMSSRPAPCSWWAAWTAARPGPAPGPPTSTTSASKRSKLGWAGAWTGRPPASRCRPAATRSSSLPTPPPT